MFHSLCTVPGGMTAHSPGATSRSRSPTRSRPRPAVKKYSSSASRWKWAAVAPPRGTVASARLWLRAGVHAGPTISRIVEPSSVVKRSRSSSFETCIAFPPPAAARGGSGGGEGSGRARRRCVGTARSVLDHGPPGGLAVQPRGQDRQGPRRAGAQAAGRRVVALGAPGPGVLRRGGLRGLHQLRIQQNQHVYGSFVWWWTVHRPKAVRSDEATRVRAVKPATLCLIEVEEALGREPAAGHGEAGRPAGGPSLDADVETQRVHGDAPLGDPKVETTVAAQSCKCKCG